MFDTKVKRKIHSTKYYLKIIKVFFYDLGRIWIRNNVWPVDESQTLLPRADQRRRITKAKHYLPGMHRPPVTSGHKKKE
jgi:hypothetical protein